MVVRMKLTNLGHGEAPGELVKESDAAVSDVDVAAAEVVAVVHNGTAIPMIDDADVGPK